MAKILLLEDNQVNRDMLVRRLKQQGYDVVTGENGTDALPQALAETPDLILMDMSMPVMDGWEATQQLKQDGRVQHIPILALTAHAMAGDREKALAVGCDDYDSKPINLTRLVGKIEALLPELPEITSAVLPTPTDPQRDPVEALLLRHLRHELCTPINAIIGYSEILLDELPAPPTPTANGDTTRSDITQIHTAGLQLLTAANTILNPDQLETHPVAQDIHSFSARVRLELLTPLSTVMGYSEILLEETSGTVLADLQRIDTAARQLLEMINDIVNLAQQQLQMLHSQTSVFSQLQLDNTANQRFAQTANRLIQSVRDAAPKVVEGHILVVDDNTINCDLLSRQLNRYGYTVATANDGHQALQQLATTNYDLVLLDIFMPDMNGLDVLAQIQQHPTWKTIPVIMISALDELNSVVHCIEMGAEDFLSKPFNPILLQAKISACLEKRRLQDQQAMYIAQRVIAGATPVPIIISRIADGQILYANRAAEVSIGLPMETLLQRSTLEFYRNPDDRASLVAAMAQDTGVQHREVECQRANGEPFWAAATMQPLMFEQEHTILTVLYDISDRKQAEHALQQAEENYRSLFEHAASGMYQSCPQGRFLRINQTMAE
ncbi:MAG: response regulator, partial [Cyanobacteria bacterium J06632_22]